MRMIMPQQHVTCESEPMAMHHDSLTQTHITLTQSDTAERKHSRVECVPDSTRHITHL